jgi:dTMP kinase
VKIISIEGPDFCGKSTIADLLLVKLRKTGKRVEKTRVPTQMITGIFTSLLRNSSSKVEPQVFALTQAADHLHHYFTTKDMDIDIMVFERSAVSLFVYQGWTLGADIEWIKELNKYNKTVPDVTVVVKVPIEELIKRSRVRRSLKDSFEKEEFIRKVAKTYYNLPDWIMKKYNVVYMDYDPDIEKMVEKIAGLV